MTDTPSPSHVFHRSAHATPPLAVRARGMVITDAAGRDYLDASGGAAVSCIGHGDPRVAEAVARQMAAVEYVHSGAFTSAPAEALAARMVASTPVPMEKVYFVGSGSEAVETAIKMARQYHLECGAPDRRHVISRLQSYHGNTLGALARSGSEARRAPYLPMLSEAPRIAPCYAYRHQRDDEDAESYGRRAAGALEAEIMRLGPENVAAFIAETVVGATTGAVGPAPGYFRHVREICDRHGVLLVLDEVMCGTFRTGTCLACEAEGVAPDIVTLAKGLGGGYMPIGAVMCGAKVHGAFAAGSGGFIHGHTYMAHPLACAAALAVQDVIAQDGLAAQVAPAGDRLDALLRERLGAHPHVGDIRGRGLLRAIELVADRGDKAPFAPARKVSAQIGAAATARGLLAYPGAGTVDGVSGDHVLLAPAYNVTDAELTAIADRMAEAVNAVLGAAGAGGRG
ncbi:MAG: aspartate aminotransferase family protein [Pikeienuella sp.]